jgi:hypothetical protein
MLQISKSAFVGGRLMMRLSDAGLRQRQTKLSYAKHRPTPWLTEDAAPAIARTDC